MEIFEVYDAPSAQLASVRDALRLRIGNAHERALLDAVENELRERQQCDQLVGALGSFYPFDHAAFATAHDATASLRCTDVERAVSTVMSSASSTDLHSITGPSHQQHNVIVGLGGGTGSHDSGCDQGAELPCSGTGACEMGGETGGSIVDAGSDGVVVQMAARQAFKSERIKASHALRALKPRAVSPATRPSGSAFSCPKILETATSQPCVRDCPYTQALGQEVVPHSHDMGCSINTDEASENLVPLHTDLSLLSLDMLEDRKCGIEYASRHSTHHLERLELDREQAGDSVQCSGSTHVILQEKDGCAGLSRCSDSELMVRADRQTQVTQANVMDCTSKVKQPPSNSSYEAQACERLPHVGEAAMCGGCESAEHINDQCAGKVGHGSKVGIAPNHSYCTVARDNCVNNNLDLEESAKLSQSEKASSVVSSLVLEDSFTDNDDSERNPSGVPSQHSSPGAAMTHVALSGDASKMEAPTWSSFMAVESLTDDLGTRAGVSAWAVGASEGIMVSSAYQRQDQLSQSSNASPTIKLSLTSATQWLDHDVAQDVTCSFEEKMETASIVATPEGRKSALHGKTARDCVTVTCKDGVWDEHQPQAQFRSGFSQRSVAESNVGSFDLKRSVKLCCRKHHSLVLGDLALGDFEEWKTRMQPTAQAPEEPMSGMAVVVKCSERLKHLSTPDSMRSIVPEKELSDVTLMTAPRQEDNTSSHGDSSQASRTPTRPGHTPPLRSPDQHCATPTTVPTIGSLSDLSRGLIPDLPQVYTASFPCFDSISALYWKLQHSNKKISQGLVQRQHDAMLIEDCLDQSIEHCEVWCAAHGEHGIAHQEYTRCSTGGSQTKCLGKQLGRDGTATPVPPTPPVKPQQQIMQHSIQHTALHRSSMHECSRKGSSRGLGTSVVTVPGWVPQVSTALTQQRWYCIVAGYDHPEVTELVGKSLQALGWKEDECCRRTNGGAASAGEPHMWNLCWTWSVRTRVPDTLLTWQRVNHFQHCRHLTRKDLLKQHLQRYATMFQNSRHVTFFQCMPTTFTLPREHNAFEEAFRHVSHPGKAAPTGDHVRHVQVLPEQKQGLNLWILKPSSLSRGRGIYLLDDLGAVTCSQTSVVQRYISDPYLYQGLKFDLRLYVLVTSFHPLEAFLYKEGFARFALVPYTNGVQHRVNTAIHLTNSSIQAADAQMHQNLPEFLRPCKGHKAGASKMSLSRLWPLLTAQGLDVQQLWRDIRATVLAALYSAKDSIPNQVTAFEMYGFDVIFDQNLKVWLLEVNASPSLGLGTELDEEVKSKLVKDMITLVNPLPFDRLALAHVLKRRKQQRTGPSRKSRRQGGGLLAGTEAEEREVLNVDLHAVLKGASVRPVGTMPEDVGQFERIAPCSLLQQFQRMQRN